MAEQSLLTRHMRKSQLLAPFTGGDKTRPLTARLWEDSLLLPGCTLQQNSIGQLGVRDKVCARLEEPKWHRKLCLAMWCICWICWPLTGGLCESGGDFPRYIQGGWLALLLLRFGPPFPCSSGIGYEKKYFLRNRCLEKRRPK